MGNKENVNLRLKIIIGTTRIRTDFVDLIKIIINTYFLRYLKDPIAKGAHFTC
jgi:hypothetical protein